MTGEALLSLALFWFAATHTPGPNTLMLLASGANFGFRNSVPHIIGVIAGTSLILALAASGAGALLTASPRLYQAVRILGLLYILWLAWRLALATSPRLPGQRQQGRPMSMIEAFCFQFVNPKLWFASVSAVTSYMPPDISVRVIVEMSLLAAAINASSTSLWTLFGVPLGRLLVNPVRARLFNAGMAMLLLLSFLPLAS